MSSLPNDRALLALLGHALARARLEQNLTQEDLATQAGISRATLQRLESGRSTQLTNLVRLLRALGLAENLQALVPAPEVRPLEQLRHERGVTPRKRARSPAKPGPDDSPKTPWTWGPDT